MIKKNGLWEVILILLVFGLPGYADNLKSSLPLAEVITLDSDVLKEKVEVYVHLPSDYVSSKREYPVLYLLDGDLFMTQAVSAVQILSDCAYQPFNLIPDFIIVGIRSNDRNRDFTPTHVPVHDGHKYPTSGGAERFYHFLIKELIPCMGKKFRVSDQRLLTGWSLGGLFNVHTFLHHHEDFSEYLAISPSLWWDNQIIVRQTESLIKKNGLPKKKLTVTLGALERGDMPDSVKDGLVTLMKKKGKNNHFTFLEIGEEGHNTAPYLALYQGLKSLYFVSDLKDSFLSSPDSENDQYIMNLSREFGFKGTEMSRAGKFLVELAVQQGKYQVAFKIAKYLNLRDPESAEKCFDLGVMYARLDDWTSAADCFEKALKLERRKKAINKSKLNLYKNYLEYTKNKIDDR